MKQAAEAQRIRSKYRRLLLLGRLRLASSEARRLVGPDCAYHLYFMDAADEVGGGRRRGHRAKAPGRRS
jgi:hypothetical protein